MNARRWWDLAVVATVVIVGFIVRFSHQPFPGAYWGAIASLVAIGMLYFLMGRRLIAHSLTSEPHYSQSTGITFQVLLILLSGIGASFAPNMLTAQGLIFPFLWITSHNHRQAVIANVTVGFVLGVGFFISLGADNEAAVAAIATQGISVLFSVALGSWIARIASWGAERQKLLDELTSAQSRLEAVNRDAGALAERERIARDLHDTIAQNLTSVVMLAQRGRLEKSSTDASLSLIEETAREALGEARALVAANAALPGVANTAEPAGSGTTATLAGSLERLAERFTRETGILVTSSVDVSGTDAATPESAPVPRDIEVVLLRCTQEGLANIRKHSRAEAASVVIARDADDVTLTVTDNGRGLDGYTIDDAHGFGLTGMRERVGLVGGGLSITDAADGGAQLVVRIPLKAARDAASAEPPNEALSNSSGAIEISAARAEKSSAIRPDAPQEATA